MSDSGSFSVVRNSRFGKIPQKITQAQVLLVLRFAKIKFSYFAFSTYFL